jgi:hypothetical protein
MKMGARLGSRNKAADRRLVIIVRKVILVTHAFQGVVVHPREC